MSRPLEFRILGPLEAWQAGRLISLGGPKQRALLAVLLINANRVVPTERLIALIWGEDAPEKILDVARRHVEETAGGRAAHYLVPWEG